MTIKEIELYDLDEFWNLISPIGLFLKNMGAPIFRGQANANWSLTPSVFREDIHNKYDNLGRDQTHVEKIIFYEYFMLLDFVHYMDDMGYLIPGDDYDFRRSIDFDNFTNNHGIDATGWPASQYFPLLAIAQHHGMPTRLLDWTRSSIVGAYFAASQLLNMSEKPEKMVLWVAPSEKFHLFNGRVNLIKMPGSTSANLAAQKGVFVVSSGNYRMDRNTKFNIDEIKNELNDLFDGEESFDAYKIIIPAKLAGDLLIRCNKFGVSAASLFPNLDGAAKAVLEFKLAKKISGRL